MFFSPLIFTSALLLLSSCCLPKHVSSFSLEQVGESSGASSQLLQPSNWNTATGDLLSSSSSHSHAHKDIRGGNGDLNSEIYGESGQPLTGAEQAFHRGSPLPLSVALGEQLKKALFKSAVGGISGATPPQEFSVAGMLKMTPIREPTCNETISRMFTAICGNGKEGVQEGSAFPAGSFEVPIPGVSAAAGPRGFIHHHQQQLQPGEQMGGYRVRRSSGYLETAYLRNLFGKRSALLAATEDFRAQTELLMGRCCVPLREDQVHCSIADVGRQLQDLCKPNRHGSRSVLNA